MSTDPVHEPDAAEDPQHGPPSPRPRSISPKAEGPWWWSAKAADRRILSSDLLGCIPSRLLVYYAVCHAISDAPKPTATIECSMAAIARRCGMTPRSVRASLRDLESIGILLVEHRRDGSVNLPNRITLLSISEKRKKTKPADRSLPLREDVRKDDPHGCGSTIRTAAELDVVDPVPPSEEQGRGSGPSKGPLPSSQKKGWKKAAAPGRHRSRSLEAARRGASASASPSGTSTAVDDGNDWAAREAEWLATAGGGR